MSVHAFQIIGGVTCFAATLVAWWVAWRCLARDRTHFISEVLALPYWPRPDGRNPRGVAGSLTASALFALGALSFVGAAALELFDGATTARTIGSLVTGALLFAIVFSPLQPVPEERVKTASGHDLLHPFFAAVFYLVSTATGIVSWPPAGPVGKVLAAAHIVSSVVLTAAVLVFSCLALGGAGLKPLPGLRILLDRRPRSPTEWVRRIQWPATLMIALDLGLNRLGF